MWGGAIKIGPRPFKGRGVFVLVISINLIRVHLDLQGVWFSSYC